MVVEHVKGEVAHYNQFKFCYIIEINIDMTGNQTTYKPKFLDFNSKDSSKSFTSFPATSLAPYDIILPLAFLNFLKIVLIAQAWQ